jgi:hypothetical protein
LPKIAVLRTGSKYDASKRDFQSGYGQNEPNSKDRNRFAASVLRPYFSVLSSDDIYIARKKSNPQSNSSMHKFSPL